MNNFPDRQQLKIMFLRESSGVYEFGTKRVEVRVTQGKILIRVGGGYMNIDEFLNQYTPLELEKFERRDPLKRFAQKVALAKTVEGKTINAGEYKDPDRFDWEQNFLLETSLLCVALRCFCFETEETLNH